MNKNRKNNKNVKNNKRASGGGGNKKRNRRRGAAPGNNGVGAIGGYALMVANPCSAQLHPGLFGSEEGFLGRFKVSYPLPSAAGATCGYVLWAPNYHNGGVNGGVAGGTGNVFIFQSNSPSNAPTNTTAANSAFGAGLTTSTVTASTIADPAYGFVNGATCRDARTVSACIRMDYLGAISSVSGQVAMVENLPMTDLLQSLPSVNNLFDYSTKSQRVSLDTSEIIYRSTQLGLDRFLAEADQALLVGATGAVSTIAPDAERIEPVVFGFAFRGITAGELAKFNFEFVKNMEWRPQTGQGLSATTSMSTGVNMHSTAIAVLDHHAPGWTTPTYNKVASAVTSMAKAVWSGIGPQVTRKAIGYAERGAGRALAYAERGLGSGLARLLGASRYAPMLLAG
nr:MAG: hypothetical protein 2 [Tombusviridae sp.]